METAMAMEMVLEAETVVAKAMVMGLQAMEGHGTGATAKASLQRQSSP
jgi:hypothetical protein